MQRKCSKLFFIYKFYWIEFFSQMLVEYISHNLPRKLITPMAQFIHIE